MPTVFVHGACIHCTKVSAIPWYQPSRPDVTRQEPVPQEALARQWTRCGSSPPVGLFMIRRRGLFRKPHRSNWTQPNTKVQWTCGFEWHKVGFGDHCEAVGCEVWKRCSLRVQQDSRLWSPAADRWMTSATLMRPFGLRSRPSVIPIVLVRAIGDEVVYGSRHITRVCAAHYPSASRFRRTVGIGRTVRSDLRWTE